MQMFGLFFFVVFIFPCSVQQIVPVLSSLFLLQISPRSWSGMLSSSDPSRKSGSIDTSCYVFFIWSLFRFCRFVSRPLAILTAHFCSGLADYRMAKRVCPYPMLSADTTCQERTLEFFFLHYYFRRLLFESWILVFGLFFCLGLDFFFVFVFGACFPF